MPTLATFNANNFFLRYRFTKTYPGDRSRKSIIEANAVATTGYLPGRPVQEYGSRYIVWDSARRELAAAALLEPDGQYPDILCLQEVENIQAIRIFNQNYLKGHYEYSLLIDAYDPRNIDVGLLSIFPIVNIRSHIEDPGSDGSRPFEKRDCLQVTFDIPGSKPLTLFINHLKSKFVEKKKGESESSASYRSRVRKSHQRRETQAREVERIVRRRFTGELTSALFAVVGDFNDTPESPWLSPLLTSSVLTDIVARHRAIDDRWTYYYRSKNRASQIDYILVSRALRDRMDNVVASDSAKTPHIERAGLGFREWSVKDEMLPEKVTLLYVEDDHVTPVPPNATPPVKVPFRFPRYQDIVNDWRKNISDHCPVKVWF